MLSIRCISFPLAVTQHLLTLANRVAVTALVWPPSHQVVMVPCGHSVLTLSPSCRRP
jgi:hypothetical protein